MDTYNFKFQILNIILISRSYFPNTNFFLIPFLILKFNGIIILCTSFEHKYKPKLTTFNLFHSLTYYASFARQSKNIIKYSIQCLIIYIILLIPIISLIIILFSTAKNKCIRKMTLKQHSNNNKVLFNKNKGFDYNLFSKAKLKFTRCIHTLICVNSILLFIIVFFSQHLIEILTFIYSLYLHTPVMRTEGNKVNLLIRKEIFLVLNAVFIVVINIYIWIFYFIYNDPNLWNENYFKHHHSAKSLLIMILLFNCQGIHYFSQVLNNSTYDIIVVCLFSCVILIMILVSIRNYSFYNIYNVLFNCLMLFAFYSGLVSGILEISANESYLNNSSLQLLKLISIIVFVAFTYGQIIKYQRTQMDTLIAQNIFVVNKNTNSDYIYRLIEIIGNLRVFGYKHFSNFDKLLTEHKKKCNKDTACESNLITFKSIYLNIKQETNVSTRFHLSKALKENDFINKYLRVLIFIENEIANLISAIYFKKKITDRMNVLYLHCNFVYYYENKLSYALYLLEEYLSKIKEIPFHYLIYFISLRNYMLEAYYKQYTKKTSLYYHKKNKFSSFYTYYKSITHIKESLAQCCACYQEAISYKHVFSELKANHKETLNSNYGLIEKIFQNCLNVSKSLDELKNILKSNFSEEMLRNPEICYLLTCFYKITHKKIPKDVSFYFKAIHYYEEVELYESSYEDIKYEHPLIFQGSNNHITYVSEKLSRNLFYKSTELVGNDYHILLPHVFTEQHSIETKRALIIKQVVKVQKNIFVLDKENYYRKVYIIAGPLPVLDNQLLVICDLSIKDQFSNCYLFVLDHEMNLIAMSIDFQEKYKITPEMFIKLQLSFCDFFAISQEKIRKSFQHKIAAINKRSNFHINNLITLFTNQTFSNNIKAFTNDEPVKNTGKSELKVIRKKETVKLGLERLKSSIQEQKMEKDWKERMQYCENLISKELVYRDNSSFEISIQLHSIGNLAYYIVKVFDKERDMQLITQIPRTGSHFVSTNDAIKHRVTFMTLNKAYDDELFNEVKQNDKILISSVTNRNSADNSTHTLSFAVNNSTSFNNTNQQLLQHLSSTTTPSLPSKKNEKDKEKELKTQTRKILLIEAKIAVSIKKLDIIKNILSYITMLLLLAITVMFIFNFYFKGSLFSVLEDFMQINLYVVKLKQNLLDLSLNVLSGCFFSDSIAPNEIDGVVTTHETIRSTVASCSKNFFIDYKNLLSFFSRYTNEPFINDISDVLYEVREYRRLNSDYSIHKYESTMDHELHHYHFMSGVTDNEESFKVCKIKDFYVYKNTTEDPSLLSNDEDNMLYYISYNVVDDFMTKVNIMLSKAGSFLDEKYNDNLNAMKMYNISLLILGILVWIGTFGIVVVYQKKISFFMQRFLHFNFRSKLFEKQIDVFSKMLVLLDNVNTSVIDNTKEGVTIPYVFTKDSKQNKLNVNSNDDNKNNNSQLPLQKNKTTTKKERKNNQLKLCSVNIINEMSEPNQDEPTFTHISFFSISIIRQCFFYILIFLVFHCSVTISNYFIDLQLFSKIHLGMRLSFYYVDKVPSYNEILLDFRIFVLYNNPHYLTIEYKDYHSFLPNFDVSDEDIARNAENDKRYSMLGNSQMAFLFYRLELEKIKVKEIESQRSSPILPQRKKYSDDMAQSSGVCKVIVSAYTEGGFEQFEGYNYDYLLHACLSIANGVIDDGSSDSLNNYFTYLFDEFIDYVKEYNRGTVNVLKYLGSELYVRIMNQFRFVWNVSWTVTSDLVSKDILILFKELNKVELIYQTVEMILCVCYIIIFVSLTFYSLRQSIIVFSTVMTRLNSILD